MVTHGNQDTTHTAHNRRPRRYRLSASLTIYLCEWLAAGQCCPALAASVISAAGITGTAGAGVPEVSRGVLERGTRSAGLGPRGYHEAGAVLCFPGGYEPLPHTPRHKMTSPPTSTPSPRYRHTQPD